MVGWQHCRAVSGVRLFRGKWSGADNVAGRRLWRAAVAALLFSIAAFLLSVAPTAAAAGGRPEAVCGAPSPGYAACFAEILLSGESAHEAVSPDSAPAGLSPAGLEAVYGFPTSSSVGAGRTIAVVGAFDDPNAAGDLTTFSQQYGLPACAASSPCLTKVDQSGGTTYPPVNASWSVETSLDVEWVHALAPAASILLVEAGDNSLDNLVAANQYAAAHATAVLDAWGGTEFKSEASDDSAFATPGVSFFVASGDTGGFVSWPATSPDAIAVGGTSLAFTEAGGLQSETAWSDGGGGCSLYETPAPAQSAFAGYGQAGCGGKRAVPDVALDGDPSSGVAVYDSTPFEGVSGWLTIGGTSASAAFWAGESAAFTGTITASTVYSGGIPFRDVVAGSNGHTAAIGYDLATGLGSWSATPGPSTLSASGSNGKITLSWTAPTGADSTSYEVLRGTSPGDESLTPLGTTSATSYTDSAVAAGTDYSYVVVAANGAGAGPWSNQVTVATSSNLGPQLPSGSSLAKGQSLVSPNGTYRLTMQSDGNLVEYGGAGPLWASGTTPSGGYAVMQTDGNLVVYTSAGTPLWASNTAGNPGAYLQLTNGGQLQLLSTGGTLLWEPGVLVSGTRLNAGQSVVSGNGVYRLTMQSDGNLVEYGGGPVWASGTNPSGSYVVMQHDGNLVVSSSAGAPLWASNTAGNPGAYLLLTNGGQLEVVSAAGAVLWGPGILAPSSRLRAGQSVVSANRVFRLVMQSDGNLVEYDGTTAVWATSTNPSGSYASMQDDGNLAVYTSGGAPLWASNTAGNAGAYLVLTNGGQLELLAQSGGVLWGPGIDAGGTTLHTGQTLYSANRGFHLTMQSDGNLVEYGPAGPVWSTSTNPSGSYASMQADGNFAVYTAAGTPLWASNTAANAGAYLLLTNAGELEVVSPLAGALWSNGGTDMSVAYQVNVAHSGLQLDNALAPPLAHRWTDTFSQPSSYPLIANGEVYVVVPNAAAYGTTLYALDHGDGRVLWSQPIPGTYSIAGPAYDAGRIYVVNFDGRLRAFDAGAGNPDWSTQLPGQYAFTSPPTAANGVVYVGGAGSGGTVYAVDEATGHALATNSVANGDHSSPALSATGVFVSYACDQAYGFAIRTLALQWHYSTSCEGGGGKTVVFADGRVFTRDFSEGDLILEASTGALLRTYTSTVAPAVDGNTLYTLTTAGTPTLGANGVVDGSSRWTFTGDGSLDSAPLILSTAAGDLIVEGSSSGMLYVLNATTGTVAWSTNVGVAIPSPDEQNATVLAGLGAGEGLLVVPAGNTVSAYSAGP
jgi:outer membrane protein assembly factor BamB